MSLDHQLPVLVKKTQMSSERTQCGLTSLLPMSCRGRAEAFARRLHTRLRNLGEDDRRCRHDPELFFDFELDYERPSSPNEEYPNTRDDDPFYEGTSTSSQNGDIPKFRRSSSETLLTNGHKENGGHIFTNTLYSERSPVKTQPTARENGEPRFSAINLDDCTKGGFPSEGTDEVDHVPSGYLQLDFVRRNKSPSSEDDDSDFESAKSDLLDSQDEIGNNLHEKQENGEMRLNGDVKIPEIEVINNKSLIGKEPVENNTSEKQFTDDEEIPFRVDETAEEIKDESIAIETASVDTESSEGDRPQRVRRCSSLKTGKTPPGTPGRKKIVRFADVLGLDLADVKTFMDEIPVIPKSAYDDLAGADIVINSPPTRAAPKFGEKVLVPLFQPRRDITEVLEKQCVCLESATVAAGAAITICGFARVRNLDFHKTVHVRYTLDRWRTYTDLQASYIQGSCDGYSDRFQFLIYAPSIMIGQRLEFAIRFQCKGVQYWDSNSGANYCYECLPLGSSASSNLPPADYWQRSFY